MSIEAVSWALNNEAVDNPTSKLVLIGLANHARPDGTASFPSISTLERYTRLSDRAVQKHLRLLEENGLIRRCDPRIVEAHIQRADRRPIGYDLVMEITSETISKRGEPGSPRNKTRGERGERRSGTG